MTSGRWNRTKEVELSQRVKELESQLEQARAATDLRCFRDMVDRAGLTRVSEIVSDGQTSFDIVEADDDRVRFFFGKNGELIGFVT